jgi:hypothetical protein
VRGWGERSPGLHHRSDSFDRIIIALMMRSELTLAYLCPNLKIKEYPMRQYTNRRDDIVVSGIPKPVRDAIVVAADIEDRSISSLMRVMAVEGLKRRGIEIVQ